MKNRNLAVDILAGFYLFICGISSIRYLAMDLSIIQGTVPATAQILCFAATISVIVYFFKPVIGCVGLFIVNVCGLLISLQNNNPKAIAFYIFVLIILSIPLAGYFRRKPSVVLIKRN